MPTKTMTTPATMHALRSNQKKVAQVAQAFGIKFNDWTLSYVSKMLVDAAVKKKKTRVAFVNAHCINEMHRSNIYDKAVRNADVILPDGSGMAIATLLRSRKRCPNLNGTDLAPFLMEDARTKGLSVFLLGAKHGVAQLAAEKLQNRFPGLKIAGTHHGYFDSSESDEIIERVNRTKPDILLVAFGVPQQDVWLAENAHKLSAPLTLGVGGLLDFLSERMPRAPKLLRAAGMEWTYRLYQEPSRMWRRYILGNPIFVSHAIVHALQSPIAKARNTVDEAIRRSIDILGASTGLVLLSPLLGMTALIIRSESRGAAIFRQTRIGKNGSPFTMYKFRSMSMDAEKRREAMRASNHHGNDAVTFKISNDPRVTTVGRFIRKFSIDELPQLWNVLKGDMSLVGPRPALPNEVDMYTDFERRRLSVKPGITCTWQINGRADIDFSGQVALDLKYIKHRSVFQDLWILLRTPIAVATARGAY